jgi:hypothetical protein
MPSTIPQRDPIAPASPSSVATAWTISSSAAEIERLAVDERLEDGLHRLLHDLSHLGHLDSGEHPHRALRSSKHPGLARAEAGEEELGEGGPYELSPPDESPTPKDPRERERARPRQQRSVQVEERGSRHTASLRAPARGLM